MNFLSSLTATSLRTDKYSILFDKDVRERFERQHADLIQDKQRLMGYLSDFERDAETARAAALAEVAKEMIQECVTTALCRSGWEPSHTSGNMFEKRLGLGSLYVGFIVSGLVLYVPILMKRPKLYEGERINLLVRWSGSLTVRLADPMVINEIIGAVVREIEDEFDRAGWYHGRSTKRK